ncbi:MAG: hypothetical protein WAZ97_01930 [Pseudolabrys sp.]|jgi:hypothetical protein
MIWPFKRDPLVSDADLLVGAVNTLAISMFPKFVDEFAFIPNDERGQRYWDFVVTIAGVFIALTRLRTLNLNEKRRLKLEKKVAVCLVRLYPTIARPAFEKCKSFFDKTYYDLLNAGYEPQLIASDTIGGWVVWAILGHPAKSEQEFTLVRSVGTMIVHSFFNWWEKTGDQKSVQTRS